MQNLIRRRIERGLIWFCSVSRFPIKRTLGLDGLMYSNQMVGLLSNFDSRQERPKAIEHAQETPKSLITDQTTAPVGRDTEQEAKTQLS